MILKQGPPLAGMIDILCETFGCTPEVARDMDADLTLAVLLSRQARSAVLAFEAKDRTMTEQQSRSYKRMLDALDDVQRRNGIPEEL